MTSIRQLDFYFDIVCPFAYIASTRIDELAAKYDVMLNWKPVLLGGLKKFTRAPKRDRLQPIKYNYYRRDSYFQRQRFKIDERFKYPPNFPVNTEYAMILLTAINDNNKRILCAKQLFNDSWINHINIENEKYINKLAVKYNIDSVVLNTCQIKDKLYANTKSAVDKHGIFGVPSIVVNKTHCFWGVDRFPFVEQMLSNKYKLNYCPVSLIKSNVIRNAQHNEIEFYFDFASPWSFLGYHRLNELKNYGKVILKPVILGFMFVAAKTKHSPIDNLSDTKSNYYFRDLDRWCNSCGVTMTFTTHFPLRSILALRIYIIDNRVIHCIFKATWQCDVNIGDENELEKVLNLNGFDGKKLIQQAKSDKHIKNILKENTSFAISKKMFGVPTYVVNKDYNRFIFGQDRLDWVKDMCCEWKPRLPAINAKI